MIFSTATVPVNPSGQRKLTRDQVWAGLVLKARDAQLFLPPGACTKCDVVFEGKDFIVREAVILGDELTEIVTFTPKRKVSSHAFRRPTTTPSPRPTPTPRPRRRAHWFIRG